MTGPPRSWEDWVRLSSLMSWISPSSRQRFDEASPHTRDVPRTLECMHWLAESNYEIDFAPSSEMSERIIFPVSPNESNGIEDARFVRFVEDDGSVIYYATYTAYNGRVILPQLIETAGLP